ncbi:MAG TPA: hypothetical protein VNM68_11520 [Candidatus Polarisedimenticolia bacterium]|nr:hypothetical protein [Candidatus Polarisedimenticolia bacterium]
MQNARIPAIRNQALIGLSLFAIGIWLAWELGNRIVAEDLRSIAYLALGIVGCAAAIAILRNWRVGFYGFLAWLLFEDLVRKFLGNNIAIYFAKDALAGLVYISLYLDIRRGRARAFRPPFLLFLSLFFWLGLLQVFNQNSPHILYGLMGLKIYFYYVPLLFVGYALIRNDEDLRKFLVANALLAGVIGTIGMIQAIVGNSFMNPAVLAPELRDLGDLDKVTPLTHQMLSLPSSVFVSAGRFSQYMTVAGILLTGAAGYLILHTRRSRKLIFMVLGIVGGSVLFSGSRGAIMLALASVLVLSVGFLWGTSGRWQQAHRMVRGLRRACMAGALALAAILLIFPNEAGSRIAFYTQTLLPSSPAYQLSNRTWDYPIMNLKLAFTDPNWLLGNGIGTASLGTQYVAKVLGRRMPELGVEEGYGAMIVEMGIVAPFLWILWSAALVYSAWKVVRRLRETRFFPIGFAIMWYAFLLLFPMTFGTLATFQNFVCNVYLWLLAGILFRLPSILATTTVPTVVAAHGPTRVRGFRL